MSFLEFERFVLIWSVLYGASTVFTLFGGVTYNVNYVWLYIHIENGLVMVMWIGQQFPTDSVQKVFGVPSLAQINTEIVSTHILCLIRSCGLWNSLLFSMLSLHWTILCPFG